MTSETSLLFYVACHQNCRISLTLIDSIQSPCLTHHCYTVTYCDTYSLSHNQDHFYDLKNLLGLYDFIFQKI